MGYILLAVVLYSTLPIAFILGGASNAPFLFVSVIWLSAGICNAIYLFARYPQKSNVETYKLIRENLWNSKIAWLAITYFDYIIFAYSLRFIDASVAAILYEMRPIFLVIFMAMMVTKTERNDPGKQRKNDRYDPITLGKSFLFGVAFVGVAFVVASQSETGGTLNELFDFTAIGGVVFLLTSAVLAALATPILISWGGIVAKKTKTNDMDDEVFFSTAAKTIGNVVSGIIFLFIALLIEDLHVIGWVGILIAVIYGSVGNGLGAIAFRIANIKTTNLSINALIYLTPVVALIWLAIAGEIKVPHIDWLMIGVAAVITANLLLNAKVEIRSAYKALIIALWVCGTVIYLHGGFALSDYAENVGMVATVFILILAFRLDRLVRRTTDEERDEFLLFRRLSTLAEQGLIDKDAPNQMREIDMHTNPTDLQHAYEKLNGYFLQAREKFTGGERGMLDELQARADTVAHSKQQGGNFGELTALGFLGFIMVGALLFFKPHDMEGWEGLFVETAAILLATTIIFLFFSIFDLQHDRTNAIFKEMKKYNSYSVAFDDASDRSGERWVSIVVCIVITATYIWLLMGKWNVFTE